MKKNIAENKKVWEKPVVKKLSIKHTANGSPPLGAEGIYYTS
jgi:hypothetical protein